MFLNDLISIIVPVYNAEKYLKKLLHALKKQTYINIEVIMIDDGSDDSSSEICKSFAKIDCRFLYFYQDNAGVSSARNKGVDIARGKYITFVDSDDWVDDDYIEELYKLLIQHNSDISIVSLQRSNEHFFENDEINLDQKSALICLYVGDEYDVGVCGKLFKNSLFYDVKFSEDIAIAEDYIVSAKLMSRAERIVFKNIPKYHYFQNPESATKVKWNPKVWSCLKAAEELYNIISDSYPEEIVLGKLRACTTVMVIPKKLSGCGRLEIDDYNLLKNELLKYYSDEVYYKAKRKEKLEFKFFLKGRIAYIIYRKIVKCKFAVILRNSLTKRGLM